MELTREEVEERLGRGEKSIVRFKVSSPSFPSNWAFRVELILCLLRTPPGSKEFIREIGTRRPDL